MFKVVHVGEEALEGLEALRAAGVDFQLPELWQHRKVEKSIHQTQNIKQ